MNNRKAVIFIIVNLIELLVLIGLAICLIIGLLKEWSIHSMIVISVAIIVINFNNTDRRINEGFETICRLIMRK